MDKGPSSLSYVFFFPVAMYGCESWTIKKAEHWRIDASELWFKTLEPHWEKTLETPLDYKEIKPATAKGI